MKMRILFLDIESRSTLDLADVGNEQYINWPLTRPVCVTIIDPGPPRQTLIWVNAALWTAPPQINAESLRRAIPKEYGDVGDLRVFVSHNLPILIIKMVETAAAIAHNATGFDRPFWERKFECQPARWIDTLPWCRCAGLPGQLDAVCQALFGLGKHEGTKIARHVFIDDGKPPKLGFVLPFLAYNVCDVLLLERLYAELLLFGDNFARERNVIETHNAINERGILCDRNLVKRMLDLSHMAANRASEEIERITGGQIKRTDLRRTEYIRDWVERHGLKMPNLRKDTVSKLIANPGSFLESLDDSDDVGGAVPSINPIVMDVLRLRVAATRMTPHKLERIEQIVSRDDRIRHVIVYGQAHTGRFSSRKVQLHNMTKGLGKLDVGKLLSQPLTWERCVEAAGKSGVDDVIATLMRSVFIPPDGGYRLVADFSSIEARGIAWIADEQQLLNIFANGGDPYVEMASTVFGVPIGEVTKDQRQLGKIICLACGYGMSAFKFAITCANWGVDLVAAGVTAEQCVEAYRGRFTKIAGVRSDWGRKSGVWQSLHDVALSAVQHNVRDARPVAKCWVAMWRGHLIIELPSGRQLIYRNARIENVVPQYARFVGNTVRPKPTVFYDHPFGKRHLYGGLLSENIVQAICRDLMVVALVKVEQAGLRPVLHVHDEIVCEASETELAKSLDAMLYYMTAGEPWTIGFPIEAKGYATRRYGKSPIGWNSRERTYRNGELIQ